MSFYIYDITFLTIFTLGVILFLYKRRANLKREGIMYLYRTQVGVNFINYVGGKYKRTLKFFSYVAIICGYTLMVIMIYLLGQIAYIYIRNPEIVRAIKIPPLMPLIPYLPEIFKIDFLPPFYFTYWIIAIAVIAIFHEFSHGILMKRYNIGIKSTGFGFLGPFLAAFVEQDEKQMEKAGKFEQIAVLSAGTFTNLVLAVLFFLLLSVFFIFAYQPAGAMFNTYSYGGVSIDRISSIDGVNIKNASQENLMNIIIQNNLEDDLILGSNGNTLELTKIIADEKVYYMDIENLKEQLKTDREFVVLYYDFPAIKLGLTGTIIEFEGKTITDYESLSIIIKDYHPGDKVNIKTRIKDKESKEEEILSYEIELAEDFNQKGRAVIGIGFMGQNKRLVGLISDFFNFFKEDATDYKPRFNIDLIVFIYNLIWWLALVNLSVALVNMLPMGIFDGGRMFYLTVLGITKSEKFAELSFKAATYFILGILLVLMLSWAYAVFV